MNIYDALINRWKPEWTNDNEFRRLFAESVNRSVQSAKKLTEKAAELRKDGRFTESGLSQELRAFARANVVTELKQAAKELDGTRNMMVGMRSELMPPKPDRSDVVGALLRVEMRNHVRSLPKGEQAALLLSDDVPQEVLQAVFEVPAVLTGIEADLLQRVQSAVIAKNHGPKIERLEQLEEATELAESALNVALVDLRKTLGFSENDRAFDNWMNENSGE